MGMYSLHKIRIANKRYNTKKNLEKLLDIIQKISGYYLFKIKNSEIVDYDSEEDMGCKWYECLHDITAASRFLPKLKIEITITSKEEYGGTSTYLLQDGDDCDYDENLFSDDENESEEKESEENED